ncbi:hypothetical protein FHW12_001333 [Dokdonella fugitiva]|uniref:Secreted protein n=1 Tax=Dokdonella fugitiva TaxID=328517 RepID=A0A839EZN0_9GAMM|nr:hypothetical protein [Dokdonella fugitiva]MBA8887119.1 hypothetical protein [Dokdonella fugitiva]
MPAPLFRNVSLLALSLVASSAFVAGNARAESVADEVFGSGFEAPAGGGVANACSTFYPNGFTLLEGKINPPSGSFAKPAKGQAFADAGFDTCMVRMTQHDVEPPQEFARNDYSRREPFNADNSRVLVYGSGGYWHTYDANTLQYYKQLNGPAGDSEVQWHPTDPNSIYYMPTNGGLKIFKLNITTNTSQVVADFTGRLPWSSAARLWTKSEGSPSRDGRYWGFQAETSSFGILGYVVYDLQTDQIVGTRSATVRPDHTSMTPSGRWFTSSDDTLGTWAWSPDFTQKKKLLHKSEHSDIAVGTNGHDLYTSIDFQSNDGDVFFVDIDACPSVPADADPASTPECPRTVLFPTYVNGSSTSVHISGKAYAKPGWVLISTYNTHQDRSGAWPWFTNKEIAVELKADGRVFGLGYHHGGDDGYWTENQGAVNRDFTRVAFNSNWSTGSQTDVDDYLIQLEPGMIPAAQ